jgi:uncharacterized protein
MSRPMTTRALIPFFALSFAIPWAMAALYLLLPDAMEQTFGELSATHPLFYLAVWSPAIAAIVVVLFHDGVSGLGRFLRRLLLWRAGAGWYALILLGIPAVFYTAAWLQGGMPDEWFPFASLGAYLAAAGLMLVLGPVEEIGWRGVALPLLQRVMAPLWAGLLLGLVWGIWHLPAFLLEGTPQSAWSFLPFLVGATAISVIVTPLFNSTRGSILLPALLHFQLNNPLWPDAQPLDMHLFTVLAVVVVWFNRHTMLRRGTAVTHVVPNVEHRSARA